MNQRRILDLNFGTINVREKNPMDSLNPLLWTKTDGYYSKKEGKDQESIQSSSTPDPGYQ